MRALAVGCVVAVLLALLVGGCGRPAAGPEPLAPVVDKRPAAPPAAAAPKVHRYGSVIKVRPERLAEYKKIHAAVWPAVLKMIKDCNIRNYSIYFKDGYLFSYFEYTGTDFKADMAKMAADPTTKKWWKVTEPMQQPLPTRKKGEWWAGMEEVFHTD
jgi:L-rhamnose mutarotase